MEDNILYNKHYIKIDEQGYIIEGWSNGPCPNKDILNAICINDKGGYQFRLFSNGEENLNLFDTINHAPIYKYTNGEIIQSTQEEKENYQKSHISQINYINTTKQQLLEIKSAIAQLAYGG